MAIGSTMMAIIYGVGVAAGIGSSQYSSSRASTSAKKQAGALKADKAAADKANADAIAKAEADKASAKSQAVQQVRARQRAAGRSKSIFTSPLGLGGTAQTIRKTLLGQ